jgi:hypothetical protein
VVAFRKQTLLSLDDCLYALQETIPHLTRSSLHRCLQRHGISHLPEIAADNPAKQPFKLPRSLDRGDPVPNLRGAHGHDASKRHRHPPVGTTAVPAH